MLIVALLTLSGGLAFAADDLAAPANNPPAKAKGAKAAAKAPDVKPERAAELLAFVREHHPELAELLEQLRPMKAAEYQAALKDLDRDVRRLEQQEKKAPKRYESELGLWKTRSRIRLLSARWSVSQDGELKELLKTELRGLRQQELAALQLEIEIVRQNLERQRRRLEQLEQQVAKFPSNDEEWLEKKLAALEQENLQQNAKRKNKTPAKAKAKPEISPTVKAEAN
jgi:hypothetical protein